MILAQKHRFRTFVRNRIILWAILVVNFGFHKIYHFADFQQKYPKYAKIRENQKIHDFLHFSVFSLFFKFLLNSGKMLKSKIAKDTSK